MSLFKLANLPVAIVLCTFLVSVKLESHLNRGFHAQNVNLEEKMTVLIDAEKFLKIFKASNETDDCAENEVFQECGTKCALSCRFASSALGITLSKEECEKTECVKGCFCKVGLVRHGEKCIPATECSAQKGRTDKMSTSQATFGPFAKIFGMNRCGPDGCSPNSPFSGRGSGASNNNNDDNNNNNNNFAGFGGYGGDHHSNHHDNHGHHHHHEDHNHGWGYGPWSYGNGGFGEFGAFGGGGGGDDDGGGGLNGGGGAGSFGFFEGFPFGGAPFGGAPFGGAPFGRAPFGGAPFSGFGGFGNFGAGGGGGGGAGINTAGGGGGDGSFRAGNEAAANVNADAFTVTYPITSVTYIPSAMTYTYTLPGIGVITVDRNGAITGTAHPGFGLSTAAVTPDVFDPVREDEQIAAQQPAVQLVPAYYYQPTTTEPPKTNKKRKSSSKGSGLKKSGSNSQMNPNNSPLNNQVNSNTPNDEKDSFVNAQIVDSKPLTLSNEHTPQDQIITPTQTYENFVPTEVTETEGATDVYNSSKRKPRQ